MRFFAAEADARQIPNPSRPSPPSRSTATASSARRRKATQAVSTARRDVRTARRGSRIMPKKFNNRRGHNAVAVPFSGGALHCRYATPSLSLRIPKNTHNTRTHPRRIARQHAEAGRRSTRGSMRREVKARPKGVRSSRITPALQKKERLFSGLSDLYRNAALRGKHLLCPHRRLARRKIAVTFD